MLAYITPLHQPLEHGSQKAGFAAPDSEKYYTVSSIRPATHVQIHGGGIPIQQAPQVCFTDTNVRNKSINVCGVLSMYVLKLGYTIYNPLVF